MLEIRPCTVCHKKFFFEDRPSRGSDRGKYCSKKCFYNRNGGPRQTRCKVCKKKFRIQPSQYRIGKGACCSSKCRVQHLLQRPCVCKVCGKIFTIKKDSSHLWRKGTWFCSKKCTWKGGRLRTKKRCVGCRQVFFTSPYIARRGRGIYCSMACVRTYRKGEKVHTWKGGITPINHKIRDSRRYREWRAAILKRDGYACVLCGARPKEGQKRFLQVDHIKPFARHPELHFSIKNGRTLCYPCHRKTPTWGAQSKEAAYSSSRNHVR
jgi:5-methylcytosine-specific restriction endonuclease McrA